MRAPGLYSTPVVAPRDRASIAVQSKVAARNEDLEDAEYVTIEYGDQSYTFEVATAGASRNSVFLDLSGDDLSVNELLAKQSTNPNALERYSN